MTGIILDSILMLLLVAAIGYGIKLERKLKTLREGQLAFAAAVTELNSAAGRAEQALATLRASGQETDLLHDRIIKARAVKQELEVLIARAPARPVDSRIETREDERRAAARALAEIEATAEAEPARASVVSPLLDDETRARRMAALMERIEGARAVMKAPSPKPSQPAPAPERASPVMQALAANHAAQQSLNRARRSLDDDLFAA
ncbi:DUF6468 domain-containing protein [Brevundimonas naejangsanensis]|uniref:DUF6468 domain-containing protein n=1 Tax=Brevundimonas naejangsanensis TaxID=588932 RepID=A0A172Y329_9CAUL|nr:DUF6468 domain-containing protein [Brevundimonas naejangsanensis]ANF53556.1 hypothetical protein DA69_01490 [Brevundimonas naejangsanensis]QBQ48749.1 hypothetical protein E3U41_08680 [Brevundimonas naejangsanensis]